MSDRVKRRAAAPVSEHDEPRPAKDPTTKNVFRAEGFKEPSTSDEKADAAPPQAAAAPPQAQPAAPAPEATAPVASVAAAPSEPAASFAELFAKEEFSPAARPPPKVGERVEGAVVQVGDAHIFVDLGERLQGSFSTLDLKSSGAPLPAVGDKMTGFILEIDPGGELRLGRAMGEGANIEQLQQALEARLKVEGKVSGVNKGGATVAIGGVRCFCPISQLDSRFVEDASRFIGQTLQFYVTEIKDRDVVLSRKALLLEEAQATRAELAKSRTKGTTLDGRVSSVREFGAFVDLGGIDGLIPTRELSHDRMRPEDVVSIGDAVKVQVIEVQSKGDELKITLSLKALSADPWDAIDAVAPIGRVVSGTVSKLEDFGAFIRLGPGLEGLLHVSQLPAPVKHPNEHLSVGQPVLVEVESVDKKRKRVSLALAEDGVKAGSQVERNEPILGQVVKVEVVAIERYGVFVQIEGTRGRGGRGLIPSKELGIPFGTDVRKDFPLGAVVQAKILETGERRLRLSVQAAEDDAERADFDTYRQEQAGQTMGSFGDLLKKRFEKK